MVILYHRRRMIDPSSEARQHEQRTYKSDWSLEHREVKPPIQLSVFTGGLNSKSPIQINFSCSSPMVLTAYTCMVVAQKEI